MYTSEQIELFDKVFNYYVDFEITKKERNNPTETLFSKKYPCNKKWSLSKLLRVD